MVATESKYRCHGWGLTKQLVYGGGKGQVRDRNPRTDSLIRLLEKTLKPHTQRCKAMTNKEQKLSCLFDLLRAVTRVQDDLNLTAAGTINNERDLRWVPVWMMDNANAVLLDISGNGADPRCFDDLYVGEKVDALYSKWFSIRGQIRDWRKRYRYPWEPTTSPQ